MGNRVNSPLYIDRRFRSRFVRLAEQPALIALGFRIFETFRSDEEQLRVFNLGVSKARPGESAHNWALAADFVPYGENGWHWPKADWHGWEELARLADQCNLLAQSPRWDKPHVQVPNWRELRSTAAQLEARRLYAQRHQ